MAAQFEEEVMFICDTWTTPLSVCLKRHPDERESIMTVEARAQKLKTMHYSRWAGSMQGSVWRAVRFQLLPHSKPSFMLFVRRLNGKFFRSPGFERLDDDGSKIVHLLLFPKIIASHFPLSTATHVR